MTPLYVAITKYGVPIVSGQFHDRKTAFEWARMNGHRWPGSRIVQLTATGPRTIWKAERQAVAA